MDERNLERLIALIVFAGTYLGLALGRLPIFRVDRTGVAIIGGAIIVVSGVVSWDRAVAAVDAHTLVLLFGGATERGQVVAHDHRVDPPEQPVARTVRTRSPG